MKVLPQDIVDFTYINIPATYDDYDDTVTYIKEDDENALTSASVALVDNYYYRSVVNSNLDFNPIEYLNIKWTKWSVSNRFAMIDLQSQTKTTQTGGDLIAEFTRGTIETLGIGNYEASQIIIEHLNGDNGVISGLTIATSGNLTSTILEGLAYVDNVRIDFLDTPNLFTASKDTYVDIDNTGTLVFTEVANGAGEPALTLPNERLAKVVTDGSSIPSVTDLRTPLNNVIGTAGQTIPVSVNEEVIDYWSYIYAEYSIEVDRGTVINIDPIGDYIRVTFIADVTNNNAACGFLIGGQTIDMGETLSHVGYNFNSYATKETDKFGTLEVDKGAVQDLVDFETIINRDSAQTRLRQVKKFYNIIVLFIVDPEENSVFENLLTLGVVENASLLISDNTANIITWQVFESI